MKRLISKIGRKILNFAFKHRLGKSRWSAKCIYLVLDLTGRFETYTNTEKTGDEHHYVPQFLLRRFRISEQGADKGQVWQFSYFKRKIEKTGISKVACLSDFYIFKDIEGKKSDFVEKKIFSEMLEHFGNTVIKRLNTIDGEPDLTFLEESTLAVFIAHQLTRVPAFYIAIEKFILHSLEHQKFDIPSLGSFELMQQNIVRNGVGLSTDELLKYKPKVSIKGINNHIGSLSRQIAEHVAEGIFRGNLHIIDVPTKMNDQFVISDNPVILLDFQRMEILQYPAWWELGKEDMWILMPISPTRYIFYTKSKRRGSVIENENEDLVRLLNFGQYLNATDEVLAKDKDIILRHLKVYTPELKRMR
ncbi:MAG TPA: DUF4238 domain-containing protein [Candidatus Paceibacterota bacterium]|nr:DUF4238 domain-containing protein [Candidatus Paceibacterota bacterium]